MPPEDAKTGLEKIIEDLAKKMRQLDTGDLARLRRMQVDGPGEAAFWQLEQRCHLIRNGDKTPDASYVRSWLQLVKILAILMPKGDKKNRPSLHNQGYSLGEALHHGGLSEVRLMRFLALPFTRRGEALERIARMLAANRDVQRGINCIDFATLLLSNKSGHVQKLARNYYRASNFSNKDKTKQEDKSA